MRLINQKLLRKHLIKNRGNQKLKEAIEKLIKDFETNDWSNPSELIKSRNDADKIHSKGFYFFNLTDHRTMILVEFLDKDATIIWCGNHDKYESLFRNNKNTILKWLKSKNWI